MDDILGEAHRCLDVLRSGGVILYPTDTIWGLGCDATNVRAVEKIIAIKGRAPEKSFVVLLDTAEKLGKYVRQVPDAAWDLVELSESPLTIVYPGAVNVAANVPAIDGTMAIRITKHPFCKMLLARFGRPLVSTSANEGGDPYPEAYGDISEKLKSQVDYVVNLPAEEKRRGKPSAILSLGVNGEIKIIRK